MNEKQMRRALGLERKAKRQERPAGIRAVVVNCRPADGMGLDVYLRVPVDTISRFEADLAAMAEVRRQHLRSPVIVRYES